MPQDTPQMTNSTKYATCTRLVGVVAKWDWLALPLVRMKFGGLPGVLAVSPSALPDLTEGASPISRSGTPTSQLEVKSSEGSLPRPV